ncbi:recombinase family protein [Peptostreptococcus faecalis]|uniref:recombinase family protein n=1 Tax=Peptostreptococcus faecalis TaxID=2045015 RepID=UPI001FA8C30E|nr:recombinase family protein [Peptostreptococcus faecalis]
MKSQFIGYARVSSIDQNLDRQIEALQEKYDLDKIYTEKVSGKDKNRIELTNMLNYVRDGDTVVILDFSRLARSLKDLLDIIDVLNSKKVNLISIKENIDTSTHTGKLMLTMIGAINEFERANIKERQAEGIAIAKEKGKYKKEGRQIKGNFIDLYNQYMNRKITKKEFANLYEISRPTLDKLIKKYEQEQNKEM